MGGWTGPSTAVSHHGRGNTDTAAIVTARLRATHEQDPGELLRIAGCLLASRGLRNPVWEDRTPPASSSKHEQPGAQGQGASCGRCQPAPTTGMCSQRHRNQKTLGERTSFYSTFVPGETELRSRHLSPSSTALLPPHRGTKNNPASTSPLLQALGWRGALGVGTASHLASASWQLQHGVFRKKLRGLPLSTACLLQPQHTQPCRDSVPVAQNLQSQPAKR